MQALDADDDVALEMFSKRSAAASAGAAAGSGASLAAAAKKRNLRSKKDAKVAAKIEKALDKHRAAAAATTGGEGDAGEGDAAEPATKKLKASMVAGQRVLGSVKVRSLSLDCPALSPTPFPCALTGRAWSCRHLRLQ